ncbi:hypothetical protein J4206_04760 [Candidatus Woesearchaeota archaeon]|nr:hypothetical protein [Candidatus Woesearchaeota archaeon]
MVIISAYFLRFHLRNIIQSPYYRHPNCWIIKLD